MNTADRFDMTIDLTLDRVLRGEVLRVPIKGGITKVDREYFCDALLISQSDLRTKIMDRLDMDDDLYNGLERLMGVK